MKTQRVIIVAVALVGALAGGPAEARIHRGWNYADLTKTAELIVIVNPIATRATGRQATLPDISTVDRAGNVSPVHAERVETQLEVVAVLKGAPLDPKGKSAASIVLHHYRQAPNTVVLNGPSLVSFDPKTGNQYMMFLVRDKDGQYVPVSGQTDPDYSVELLRMKKP